MTNFWIDLKETKSGWQFLSCKVNDQHYTGWLKAHADKEGKEYKSAGMKPCLWDKCTICHPELSNLEQIF